MAIYTNDKLVANNYTIDNTVYCVPIGSIIPYASTTLPKGFLLCNGAEISKTDYADLYTVIGDTFGTATDNTKFKLPDLRDKFVQGANGNLGTSKEAGLPNITGHFAIVGNDNAAFYGDAGGAFTTQDSNYSSFVNGSGQVGLKSNINWTFNASASNSIYGNSTTVQPPAVCLCYIIKATKLSDIPVDVSGVIDDNATGADSTWSSTKLTTELDKNVAKEQGVSNANKRLVVGTDGNLGLTTLDGYVTDAIVVTDEFDNDILKWDTGTYKISHRTDLVNLPFDVDNNNLCFRLEHHNLKKWEGNHNPNTETYGVRYSVLYCQNGSTYTREYESGATAGTYTKDTGWRKSTQDKYSLVTNSQTFKFTIKKNRFSWFGFAKFEYSQGASKAILSEIDIAITTAAISYTVAKGNDIIESMTYTFDADNNPTIGIKLKEKVYGTQSLTVPSEFGTITEFSGEEFTGNTALIKMTADTPVLTNYSTEEKEIGTWVDGKKLYRKCYSATSISDTTGSITLDNGLSGITPIKIGGAFDITSNVYPLPYGIMGNADGYCIPVYQNMNGSFVLRYSKDVFGTIFRGYNVFIEYTKN